MRPVTELDFRQPEYRDAKVEDYEFRSDGQLVRKDRWKVGIQTICSLVGLSVRDFEIPDVVAAVEALAAARDGWNDLGDDEADYPNVGASVCVQLADGSELRNVRLVVRAREVCTWEWAGGRFDLPVVAWRKEPAD